MKGLIGSLLAMLLVLPAAQLEAQVGSPFRRVVHRDQLDALQIHRFSDLVEWFGHGGLSQDGVTWSSTTDGVPGPSGDGIAWIVDGVPSDVGSFGTSYPELLPALVQQIDSLIIVRSPVTVAGRLYPRGVVEVFSAASERGTEALIWARHGAETGDPGPFTYTSYRTRGVDQTGPDGSISLSVGSDRWGASGVARYLRTDVSDAVLRDTYGEDYLAFTQVRGGQGGAWLRAGESLHRVSASQYNQIGHSAYFGQQSFGRIDLTRSQLSAEGSWTRGSASADYLLVRRGLEALAPVTDRPDRSSELEGAVHLSFPLRSMTAGLAVDVRTGELAEKLGEDRLGISATVAEVKVAGWKMEALAGLFRIDQRNEVEALVNVRRALTSSLGVELFASRGIEQRVTSGLEPVEGEDQRSRTRLLRGGMGAVLQPSRAFQLAAQLFGALDRPSVSVADPGGFVELPVLNYVGVEARADFQPSPRWRWSGEYLGLLTNGRRFERGDPPLGQPTHQLRASGAFAMAPSFRLSGATLVQSQRRYPDRYQPPSGSGRLPAIVRVDLGIDKSFWEERFRTTLSLRNLLDRTEQRHPNGADFGFRYFLTGSIRLP